MRGRIRGWWPLAAVAPFVIGAFWLLYVVWQPQRRIDLATYGAFAVPVVTLVAGWIAWAWRATTNPAGPAAASRDVDRVTDLLAMAVQAQWQRAAGERGLVAQPIPVTWGRPSLPLAGPVTAATGSRRFAPLPGLTPARETQLAAGQIDDLHAVYGGLRSGRLVIAGPPGSGKSGAAVLLVLAALEHRDRVGAQDRVKIPVPVLFTAQNWDPRRQPVKEWLTGRLQETYPLFAGQMGAANAGGLIDAGKMTLILDGLDEIAEELRPLALQALNPASFRVVVLSRTAEMAYAASQRGVLQGAAAIELRTINPSVATDYLERVQLDPPPNGWRDLLNHIRASPASPLAEALNTPLALTLIRDTYQSDDDARELLDLCDTIQKRVSGTQAAEEVTDHLLDRVLPAAYASRPGEPRPRYDLPTAQNALAKIAARMNQDGTRDLPWWHVPRWVPFVPRIVMGGLVAWLVAWFVVGLVAWFVIWFGVGWGAGAGLGAGVWYGLAYGFVFGLAAGAAASGMSGAPAKIGKIGRPQLRRVFGGRNLKLGLVVGLVAWLVAGLIFQLILEFTVAPPTLFLPAIMYGLVAGLTIGVVYALAVGLADAFADPDSTTSPSPSTSWRSDRRHSMAIGLVVGLVSGLVVGVLVGVVVGLSAGLVSGLVAGLVAVPVVGLVAGPAAGLGISHAWPTTLAAAQLTRRWHTPLHLLDFLDDARERNVLRTVGPVYQFRHARLQDRLAAAVTNGRNEVGPSRSPLYR